jgi:hypothetical protein
MGEPITIHRDELATGVTVKTGEPLTFQFGETTGEFHIFLRDHEGHDPIPGVDYTIDGPHDVSFSGKTGDDGSIHHTDPKVPIDAYKLRVSSLSATPFPILPSSILDAFILRIPGFPNIDPLPPDLTHTKGPDCIKFVSDPPDWMQKKPARDLTMRDARRLVIWYLKNGWIEFHTPMTAMPTFKHDGIPQVCSPVTPHLEDKIVIKPTVHGVVWLSQKYALSKDTTKWRHTEWIDLPTSNEHDPREKIAKLHNSRIINQDYRNVVLLERLTRYLKEKWGATHLYHIGMGAGGKVSTDCHNTGRAIDFAGGMGTCPADHPVPELRNFAWDLDIWHDWGLQPENLGSYRLQPNPGDLDKHAAYHLFLDLYNNFLQGQCQNSNPWGNWRCPYDPNTGDPTGADPNAKQNTLGPSSGFICQPDYINAPGEDLRERHANHYHFQVGATKDDTPTLG